MQQKQWYENVLAMMELSLEEVRNDNSFEVRRWNETFFRRLGELLEKSKLPKKKEDVYFIIDELEKIRNYVPFVKLADIQDYLTDLVGHIRATFFKTQILKILKDKGFVKITQNDGTEVIFTKDLQVITDDFVAGKIPDGESCKICFSVIKLRDGILPYPPEQDEPRFDEENGGRVRWCICCGKETFSDYNCEKCGNTLCFECYLFQKVKGGYCRFCAPCET